MLRTAPWLSLCLAIIALGGGLLSAAPPKGQGDGSDFLPADQLKGADSTRYTDLRNGRVDFNLDPAENRRVLEMAAKWYVNRLTWPQFYKGPEEGPIETIHASKMAPLVAEANRQLPEYRTHKGLDAKQEAFVNEFSKQLIAQIKTLLQAKEWPISRINAAMILAHLGKVGYEPAADAMVDLISDPKETDAVKLYALRGLKDLFALQHLPERPYTFQNKERERKSILALLDFLVRKVNLAGASEEEVNAFRWVRREAIKALAETRYPAVMNDTKVVGPTAWQLLRVCCKDGFDPEPSLAERVEAAIGVLRLNPRLSPGYNADYAVHGVGALIRDYVSSYNKDFRDNKAKSFVWKYDALRLAAALQVLRGNLSAVRNPAAAKFVTDLILKYESCLRTIEDARQVVADSDKDSLEQLIDNNQPAATSVYEGVPDSVIKRPAAGK
jgi:hypothetical protein